jgi:2-polyprenyl-6-methoxyphenol hydroxylase-like FAD-dependent oxidoreductase
MLLARSGYRVLMVDRATFPSDTVSTHLIHPPGMAALARWGLSDRIVASGCPPIHTYDFDFGPFTISGRPATDGTPIACAPRRTVLDTVLVGAAAEAGVEVREQFTVDSLLFENGQVVGVRGRGRDGAAVSERARMVVGADGRYSFVADTVNAEEYDRKPKLLAGYYSYWSDLPVDGHVGNWIRPNRGFAAWPTNDDLTLVIAGWPYRELEANRGDIEGNFQAAIDLDPAFAERFRAATREERFVGTAVRGFFRKPYGPGWALVGDAGYNKDFVTAQGINDAFRDAELCAAALDQTFSGARNAEDALAEYQSTRDAHVRGIYELTADFASLEPPSAELQHLLAAVHGNQAAMDDFARVIAGMTSPGDFFSEENVGLILAAAA